MKKQIFTLSIAILAVFAISSCTKDDLKSTEAKSTESATKPTRRIRASSLETKGGYWTVTAPLTGTFYRANAPDAAPYVQVGFEVVIGDILCSIEAMGLYNEIEAEKSGTIVEIRVENGKPVQYGQPLFGIR